MLRKHPFKKLSDGKQAVKSCGRRKAVTQFVTTAGTMLAKIIFPQNLTKASKIPKFATKPKTDPVLLLLF